MKHTRECCEVNFSLIMSSSNDHANREEGQNQSFLLEAMQQHFARLEVRMNNIHDQIKQNEEPMRRMIPQNQRQGRRTPTVMIHEEATNGREDEEEDEVEEKGRFPLQRGRHGRGVQRNSIRYEEFDRNLGSIKMTIPPFQGNNGLEAYLEWENKVGERLTVTAIRRRRKSSLQWLNSHINIWWDQLVTTRRRNHEHPIMTQDDMNSVMRKTFVPNYYYRELYDKLQGLVQGSKSVDEYYKEMKVAMI